MQKAVFLDRDGVINDGTAYYTFTEEAFVFNEGVFEGLKLLQENGFILIVITNQSGVAKGVYSLDDVKKVHRYMIQELIKRGIMLEGIFLCPHHPDVQECSCRKPGAELFERAIKDFDIDVKRSFMIGDSDRDIAAAAKVKVRGFKITKNENIVPYCKQIVDETNV